MKCVRNAVAFRSNRFSDDGAGAPRDDQSVVRSSSLSDVFERVFSSTFFTITAQ